MPPAGEDVDTDSDSNDDEDDALDELLPREPSLH